MATHLKEDETRTKMAAVATMVPAAELTASSGVPGAEMTASTRGMSPSSLLSQEEEAATRRFLENVNNWRAANSREKVSRVLHISFLFTYFLLRYIMDYYNNPYLLSFKSRRMKAQLVRYQCCGFGSGSALICRSMSRISNANADPDPPEVKNRIRIEISVGDPEPDPQDPHVFGPPGSLNRYDS